MSYPPHKKREVDAGDSASTAVVPGSCVAKAPTPVQVVRKSLWQLFCSLPPEIQWMVYEHLLPRDILHLARTSKELRLFFLDRKQERFWREARQNMGEGFPARPSFISEPAFIHYLYATDCRSCGYPEADIILNGHLGRLCDGCLKERTVWIGHVPCTMPDPRCIHILCTKDLIGYRWFLDHIAVQRPSSTPSERNSGDYDRVLKDDLRELYDQLDALPEALDWDECNGKPARGAKEKLWQSWLEYLQELRDGYRRRIQEMSEGIKWVRDQETSRLKQRRKVVSRNFAMICDRLCKDLGWTEELDALDEPGRRMMTKLIFTDICAEMNESVWQKVLLTLTEFLEGVRKRIFERRYRNTLRTRFALLEEAIKAYYVPTLPRTARMDCRPQYVDLAFEPECRAIIDSPVSETITIKQLAPLVPLLSARWEAKRRQALLDYLRPHLGEIPTDVDPLTLAIAQFKDESRYTYAYSRDIMRYPNILAAPPSWHYWHPPMREAPREEDEREDTYTRAIKTLQWGDPQPCRFEPEGPPANPLPYQVPHHLAPLAGPAKASALVDSFRKIVRALRFDPARATYEDLEACGKWLRCVTCESTSSAPMKCFRAWTWRGAAEHDRLDHAGITPSEQAALHPEAPPPLTPVEWQVVDDEYMDQVRATVTKKEEETRLYGTMGDWDEFSASGFIRERALRDTVLSCSLCADYDNTITEGMRAHLEDMHGIRSKDCFQELRDGILYFHPSSHGARLQTQRVWVHMDGDR